MTMQSLTWALDQPIPGTAKLVLIGLAADADDETGEVRFNSAAISRIAHVKLESIPRYLGALERNQYLDKTEVADGRKYWLALSRDSLAPWSWSAEDLPEQTESAPSLSPASRTSAPSAFSKARQAEAREKVSPPKTESTPQQVPVIEGTDAARAWIAHDRAHGRVTPFIQWVQTKDGKNARGFYKPTLFPPRVDRIDNLEGAA